MGLTYAEDIAAAFRELPIFSAVQAIVATMPASAVRKAVDYAPFLGAKAGTVVYKILAESQATARKFADIVDILELDAASPLGQQLLAVDQLIADAKS
jgi:hypothetical protein